MSIYLGTTKMSGSAGIEGGGGSSTVSATSISLSVASQTYITVNGSGKTIALPSSIPSSWIGTTSTSSAAGNHAHGQLTNDGKISTTSVSLASGDSIVFVDYSDSNKIKKSSITFDGSTTTKYLSQAGTWVSAPSQTTVSYSPTVTSSTTGSYVIGTLTVNGTNTTIYGKDTSSSGGSSVILPTGYSASNGITLSASSLTTIATIDGTPLRLKTPAGSGGSNNVYLDFYYDDELDNQMINEETGQLTIDLSGLVDQRSFTTFTVNNTLYTRYYSSNPLFISIILTPGYYQHENYVLVKNTSNYDLDLDIESFSVVIRNSALSPTCIAVDNNLNVAGNSIPSGYSGLYSFVNNGSDIVVAFSGLYVNI